CNIGTAEYNLALGERRANAVHDYLTSRGIAADRLRTVSYGEERPKYDNAREETRRLNRRAAVVGRAEISLFSIRCSLFAPEGDYNTVMIRRSAADSVAQLVAALGADDDIRREIAIARLRVIGRRAMDRLLSAYDAAPDRETRLAVLRAMETAADGRAIPLARRAFVEGGDIGIAAVAAVRALLDASDLPTATSALDA